MRLLITILAAHIEKYTNIMHTDTNTCTKSKITLFSVPPWA